MELTSSRQRELELKIADMSQAVDELNTERLQAHTAWMRGVKYLKQAEKQLAELREQQEKPKPVRKRTAPKPVKSVENMLNQGDVARLFGVSTQTVARWRKMGMPFYRLGRSLRFFKHEVEAWVMKNRREGE